MKEEWQGPLERLDDYRWQIPRDYMPGMRVPGLIYASESLLRHIRMNQTPKQVANVAHLPGIVRYSLAMPDIHWGYGLPIGGVAATDPQNDGVISPGGVGSDINCGVRLLRTNLEKGDVAPKITEFIHTLFSQVPCGVGSSGKIKVGRKEERRLLIQGARWAVERGYGTEDDLEHTEEKGEIQGADPDKLSQRAYERGKDQAGTLGSGNHFIEIQAIDEIYEPGIAGAFGLDKGRVTVMIHSGSRGLGYQVCEDYMKAMVGVMAKYGINLPDRQLACAPINSPEGKNYLGAMRCAANYAWANRQCLMHLTRGVFEKVFGMSSRALGMELIYDVAHNIAKFERHDVDGEKRLLCVHRKGATRAFPPGHPDLPEEYKTTGQPMIIPGDMGRFSYLLVGTDAAYAQTFASTCHGAGRMLSRTAAKKKAKGRSINRELADKGIVVMARGKGTLAEEAPEAYKDVNEVVDVVQGAGISKKVCRMRPLGVIKG